MNNNDVNDLNEQLKSLKQKSNIHYTTSNKTRVLLLYFKPNVVYHGWYVY